MGCLLPYYRRRDRMNNSTNAEYRHGEVSDVKVTALKPNPIV
jgi:hypothetical protein